MLREDYAPFTAVMADLCAAFDRPVTDERVRVFWETLKHVHLHDLKRSAESWKRSQRKFPTPRDLMPDRPAAPPPKPRDDGPPMSPWAIAANKILFAVAYQGNRGFRPVGDLMPALLKAKADYVRRAEEAEANGDQWDHVEFNRMCREGFETILEREVA
jgi:hypothetical protein